MSNISDRLATLQVRKTAIYRQRLLAVRTGNYAMAERLDAETERIEHELEILRNVQGSR